MAAVAVAQCGGAAVAWTSPSPQQAASAGAFVAGPHLTAKVLAAAATPPRATATLVTPFLASWHTSTTTMTTPSQPMCAAVMPPLPPSPRRPPPAMLPAPPAAASISHPQISMQGTPDKLGSGMGCMWGAVAESAAPWIHRLPGMLLGARSWAPPLAVAAPSFTAATRPDLSMAAPHAYRPSPPPLSEPLAQEGQVQADLEYAPVGTMSFGLPEEVPLSTMPLGTVGPTPPVSAGFLTSTTMAPASPNQAGTAPELAPLGTIPTLHI